MRVKAACHPAGPGSLSIRPRSIFQRDDGGAGKQYNSVGGLLLASRMQPVEPLGKRALYRRLDRKASLTLILLLSLGLWAAIWMVVGSLAAVVVG
jgi:hypothetical protein